MIITYKEQINEVLDSVVISKMDKEIVRDFCDRLENDIVDNEEKIIDLNTEISKLNNEISELNTEISGLNNKISELEEKIDDPKFKTTLILGVMDYPIIEHEDVDYGIGNSDNFVYYKDLGCFALHHYSKGSYKYSLTINLSDELYEYFKYDNGKIIPRTNINYQQSYYDRLGDIYNFDDSGYLKLKTQQYAKFGDIIIKQGVIIPKELIVYSDLYYDNAQKIIIDPYEKLCVDLDLTKSQTKTYDCFASIDVTVETLREVIKYISTLNKYNRLNFDIYNLYDYVGDENALFGIPENSIICDEKTLDKIINDQGILSTIHYHINTKHYFSTTFIDAYTTIPQIKVYEYDDENYEYSKKNIKAINEINDDGVDGMYTFILLSTY